MCLGREYALLCWGLFCGLGHLSSMELVAAIAHSCNCCGRTCASALLPFSVWRWLSSNSTYVQLSLQDLRLQGEGQRRVLRILQLSRRDLCLAQPFPTADSHMVSVLIAFATASVGCQYLPGGLGREPHCHAGGRKHERRMTTMKEMSVVLLRAGIVSARPLRPKGVPWNGFSVLGVVGLVWVCVLVRVPRLLCLGLVRAGRSLIPSLEGRLDPFGSFPGSV